MLNAAETRSGYDFLYEIDNIFTEEQCKELIERADTTGWKFIDRGIADYHRAMVVDPELANYLFEGIKHLLPSHFNGERIVGLNDYFRFSKYDDGGRFERHSDGINVDKQGNRACMTLNIFLNEVPEGGGTLFYRTDQYGNQVCVKNVRPKSGRGALFYNQIVHEGEPVTKGPKYLIRTDVMAALQ